MASDQTKINSISGLNMAKVYVKDCLEVIYSLRISEGFNKTFLSMVSISECNNIGVAYYCCALYAQVFRV